VFSRDKRERRFYWRPSIDEDVTRLKGDELVEYYVALATEMFRRYSQLAPWSDLTGGFDSRLLNVLLDRAGLELRRCTRGDEDADEVRVAREVARRAGWEWVLFTLPPDWGTAVRELLPLALSWGDAQRNVLSKSQGPSGSTLKRRRPTHS
jgi:asparagine synthetase B (glutamine-hydrolysing)